MKRITLPVLASRRLVQLRHSRRYRYEFGHSIEAFAVMERSSSDAPIVVRESFNDRALELRVHGPELFRAVTSQYGEPASLESLAQAEPAWLLEGEGEDDEVPFWRDHPSSIAREHWAPEEVFKHAPIADPAVPRFWEVVYAGLDDAMRQLRETLAKCFLIGNTLWRPTHLPGWVVGADESQPAHRWLTGITLGDDTAMYFDGNEEASVAALRRKRARGDAGVADVLSVPSADLQTLRLCVSLLARCASPNVAAYGPKIAALYWSGRGIMDHSDWSAAPSWLEQATLLLKDSANDDLVRFASLLEQRSASRFDFDVIR